VTRVVDRAGAILGAFTHEQPTLSLTECVAATGLNKSSALRLLVSLEEIGLVERVDTRWRLGPRTVELALIRRESVNLQREVVPLLRAMRDAFGMSVAYSVPDRHDMLYLERLDSPDAVGLSARLGARAPMWAGASGSAVLARLGTQERERALDTDEWRALPKRMRTAVLAEVERAQSRGFAVDRGQGQTGRTPAIAGAATALCNLLGEPVAALSVIVPPQLFDERMEARIGAHLLETARSLGSVRR
jgi:DNA-binding IclR family transcriptional regulator